MSSFKPIAKWLCVGFLAGFGVTAIVAYAQAQIPGLSGPPALLEDPVDEPRGDLIPCGEIVDSLRQYNELHFENGEAVAGYLQAVGTHMYDWNDIFIQLEGRSVVFRRSYFEPIQKTAEINDEVSEMIFENTDQLAQRIEVVIESLETCL